MGLSVLSWERLKGVCQLDVSVCVCAFLYSKRKADSPLSPIPSLSDYSWSLYLLLSPMCTFSPTGLIVDKILENRIAHLPSSTGKKEVKMVT